MQSLAFELQCTSQNYRYAWGKLGRDSKVAWVSSAHYQMFELQCTSQNYAWGKLGRDSKVASLLSNADPQFKVDEEKPYAELWMGTHPSGPSTIVSDDGSGTTLETWVRENPAQLGDKVREMFQGALPYLFKVLSVRTALSIQAHPTKALAEELHKKDPKNYKDSNHKPEMAIALTDFNGLCGFRPIKEIAAFMQSIEEFSEVVGSDNAKQLIDASNSEDAGSHREAVKKCFSTLMTQDKGTVQTQLKKLVDRVKALESAGEDTSSYVGDILLKLDREFPGDGGGFSIYFLNVMRMKRGDAIFLEANLPHAYLSGDCMECMACSDNVVRAGLTPKYIDTETLLGMVNYDCRSAEENKYQPTSVTGSDCNIRKFTPPISDFAVTEIQVPEGQRSTTLPAISSASILICIEGDGQLSNRTISRPIGVKSGTVLFISANEEAQLQITSANQMLLYRAHAGC